MLGVSFFGDIGDDKLWISFGIGSKLRNISIHDICSTMSSAKAKALHAFNVLTGSDNKSFFSGTAKDNKPEMGHSVSNGTFFGHFCTDPFRFFLDLAHL